MIMIIYGCFGSSGSGIVSDASHHAGRHTPSVMNTFAECTSSLVVIRCIILN